MYISENDAEGLLAPHYETFISIVEESFDDMISYTNHQPEGFTHTFDKKLKTTMMWNWMVNRAKDAFSGVDGTKVISANGQFGILFLDQAFIRFKKLNRSMASSNIPTAQQMKISSQISIPELPQTAAYLNVGYTVNATWSKVASVNIVYERNKKPLWNIDILNKTGYTRPIFTLPTTVEPTALPSVKLKDELKTKKYGNSKS